MSFAEATPSIEMVLDKTEVHVGDVITATIKSITLENWRDIS